MSLERRTRLRSGPPPKRRTPLRQAAGALARRSELRRGGRLRPMSEKRAAEHDDREAVRAAVVARDGEFCAGRRLVPQVACSGPLDVDEVVLRSGRPGGHLDPANCQLLCRFGHHRWKHDNPDAAAAVGLRRWSWQ